MKLLEKIWDFKKKPGKHTNSIIENISVMEG